MSILCDVESPVALGRKANMGKYVLLGNRDSKLVMQYLHLQVFNNVFSRPLDPELYVLVCWAKI